MKTIILNLGPWIDPNKPGVEGAREGFSRPPWRGKGTQPQIGSSKRGKGGSGGYTEYI